MLKVSTDEWPNIIEQQQNSGESQAEWCRNNNVNVKRFGYWLRKLRKQSDKSKSTEINWIPVSIEEPKNTKLNIKIGPAVIEVEKGFDAELLSEVVKALGAVC